MISGLTALNPKQEKKDEAKSTEKEDKQPKETKEIFPYMHINSSYCCRKAHQRLWQSHTF